MGERYIAFDVETPNYANDRMSAIGISIIENGRVTEDLYTLVNPEEDFDSFNIQLTGITPQMVADKPAFPELWRKIEPVMGSGLLIAHNAPFDMGVLARCLNDYGISWKQTTYYACTCVMGRVCYPELGNHKLNTLCDYLQLDLDHHNAGSDSRACAELLLDYMGHGLTPDRFRRQYDLAQRRTLPSSPRDWGNKQTDMVCPKCGGMMVKRRASRGPNAGKEFYGCSNFPQCRCIVDIP